MAKKEDLYSKMLKEHKKTKKRFIGYYSSYSTSLTGDNVVDAIKYFYGHYNAILSIVIDFEKEIIYQGKENDETDVRGYYNYSYYEYNTDKLIYNRDDATRPLDKVTSTRIIKESEHGYIDRSGKFYACGFEGHHWLSDELFLTKSIPSVKKTEHHHNHVILEERGWIKISSKRIHFLNYKDDGKRMPNLTELQKKTIERWLDVIGDENYNYKGTMRPKSEIITRLHERD